MQFGEKEPALVRGTADYLLTDNDFAKMEFADMEGGSDVMMMDGLEAYLDKSTNAVRLRKVEDKIGSFDDLQKFIDSLGEDESGTADDPVDIVMPVSIDMIGPLPVHPKVFITIAGPQNPSGDKPALRFTGGGIDIQEGGWLRLRDLTLDGCSGTHTITVDGTLVIDVNVTIVNIVNIFINVGPTGTVIIKGGGSSGLGATIIRNGGGTVRYEGGDYAGEAPLIVNEGGTVHVIGGTLDSRSDGGCVVNGADGTTYITGGIIRGGYTSTGTTYVTGGEFYASASMPGFVNRGGNHTVVIEGGTFHTYGYGSTLQPGIYTEGDITICGCAVVKDIRLVNPAVIRFTTVIENVVNIYCDCWPCYVGATVTVGADGYRLTEDDFDKIVFVGLPDNLVAEYDAAEGSVRIVERAPYDEFATSDDLQAYIDSLGKDEQGTHEKPVTAGVAAEGMDVTGELIVRDGVHILVRGPQSGPRPIRLKGGGVHIVKGGCLHLENIVIDGCGGTRYINVEGTLVIESNVTFTDIASILIRVAPGGRVVVNGCHADLTVTLIENKGGEVIINGGVYISTTTVIINRIGTLTVNGGSFVTPRECIINHEGATLTVTICTLEGGIVNYGECYINDGDFWATSYISALTGRGSKSYTYISGGTFHDCGVWPGIDVKADVELCGCVSVTVINVAHPSTLLFFSEIRSTITINVTVAKPAKFIVASGTAGYRLTKDDYACMKFNLPGGYTTVFDAEKGEVSVEPGDPTGIDGVESDASPVADEAPVYDLQGRYLGRWADVRASGYDGICVVNGRKVKAQR